MQANELYHYGVQGMKWGVRRYQNPDGSYTAEGLKRYGRSSSSGSSKSEVKAARKEQRKAEKEANKPIHKLDSLSDEDLNKGIARLQKETQYLQLTNQKYRSLDELSKNERSLAAKKTDSALKKVGQITMRVVEPALVGLGIYGVRQLLKNSDEQMVQDVMSRFKKK